MDRWHSKLKYQVLIPVPVSGNRYQVTVCSSTRSDDGQAESYRRRVFMSSWTSGIPSVLLLVLHRPSHLHTRPDTWIHACPIPCLLVCIGPTVHSTLAKPPAYRTRYSENLCHASSCLLVCIGPMVHSLTQSLQIEKPTLNLKLQPAAI